LNIAVIDLAVLIVTAQVIADPEQSPAQPTKTDPTIGVGVRVTDVPLAKEALQVEPQ
jgi:hypothetical protein